MLLPAGDVRTSSGLPPDKSTVKSFVNPEDFSTEEGGVRPQRQSHFALDDQRRHGKRAGKQLCHDHWGPV